MTSFPARLADRGFRILMKREPASPDELVRRLRRIAAAGRLPGRLPSGVKVHKTTIGNEPAVPPGVPAVCVSPDQPTATVLYLHGGAFVSGRFSMYASFCGQLASRLNARVFWIDYRLAPEAPYPAALDDACHAYNALATDYPDDPLAVVGDSAGGNLTLATLLRLRLRDARDAGAPDSGPRMPACAVAISPGADAVGDSPSRQANAASDAMLTPGMIETATALYLDGHNPRDPYVSPVYGDFSGLPPLMVTASESEALRDDAYRVAHRARQAGVSVTLRTRWNMPHIWPVLYSVLPEARPDVAEIAGFMHRHLSVPVEGTRPAPRTKLHVAHGSQQAG
jgi:monoterpene epsilon-lactone hydrolase